MVARIDPCQCICLAFLPSCIANSQLRNRSPRRVFSDTSTTLSSKYPLRGWLRIHFSSSAKTPTRAPTPRSATPFLQRVTTFWNHTPTLSSTTHSRTRQLSHMRGRSSLTSFAFITSCCLLPPQSSPSSLRMLSPSGTISSFPNTAPTLLLAYSAPPPT